MPEHEEIESFLGNLAELCRRSSAQNWSAVLPEALQFFADALSIPNAAVILLDENEGRDYYLPLNPQFPVDPQTLKQWALRIPTGDFSPADLTRISDLPELWMLPVPRHVLPPQTLIFLAGPFPSPEAVSRAEQLADLLTPLFQNIHEQRQRAVPPQEGPPSPTHNRLPSLNQGAGGAELLAVGLNQARQVADMEWGGIYLWDTEARLLRLKISQGALAPAFTALYSCPPERSIPGHALTRKELFQTYGPLSTPEPCDPAPDGSRINLPLIIEGHPLGVLSLADRALRVLSPEKEPALRSIADQLALALQREQMAAQLQQQLHILHDLYEFSAAFLPQVGTREVIFILLRTLTDLIPTALGATFYQPTPAGWQRIKVYTTHFGTALSPWLREGPARLEEIVRLENCLRQGLPIIDRASASPLPADSDFWSSLAGQGGRQCLYFPLSSLPQEIAGVVGIIMTEERALSAQESALIQALLQQAMAALARVRLYETSREAELRLRAILESSQDGIFLIGQNLQIRYVNSSALNLLALSGEPETWQGRTFLEAVLAVRWESRELAAQLAAACRDELRNRLSLHPANDLVFETAHHRTLTLRRWPVYSERQSLLGILFLFRDVTEQKALEKMRDELLRMLVHDMRNPLSIILSALQVMQDPLMKDDTSQILEIARNNTEQVLTLVTAILDIGKLESGQFELCQQSFRLASFIPQLKTALALSAKKPHFEADLPADLPMLWADVNVVGRILQNLIENALKFVPPTEGRIRLSARSQNDWIQIEVYNDGPAVPSEIGDQLFQKFKTVHYRGQGYGLGLTFCRLAVEAHGGRIWAENHPQSGVSFFFTLPAVPALVYPGTGNTL